MDRAPAWCLGGHNFESCRRLGFFLCSTLVSCCLFNYHSCFTDLEICHLSFFHQHWDIYLSIDSFQMTSRRPYLCTKNILWELNYFHMLKLSFIPSNLQSCWLSEQKRSINYAWFENLMQKHLPLFGCPRKVPIPHSFCKWPLYTRQTTKLKKTCAVLKNMKTYMRLRVKLNSELSL